jgi:hypothetical protein
MLMEKLEKSKIHNKNVDTQMENMLRNVLQDIQNEQDAKENSEADVARKIHDLFIIREFELQKVENNRIVLSELVKESKTVLDRFHQSIDDW